MVLLWILDRILQLLLLPVLRLRYEPLRTAEILAQHLGRRGSLGYWQQRKQYDPVVGLGTGFSGIANNRYLFSMVV